MYTFSKDPLITIYLNQIVIVLQNIHWAVTTNLWRLVRITELMVINCQETSYRAEILECNPGKKSIYKLFNSHPDDSGCIKFAIGLPRLEMSDV